MIRKDKKSSKTCTSKVKKSDVFGYMDDAGVSDGWNHDVAVEEFI